MLHGSHPIHNSVPPFWPISTLPPRNLVPLSTFKGSQSLQPTLLCHLLASTLFLVTQLTPQEFLSSQTHPHHLPSKPLLHPVKYTRVPSQPLRHSQSLSFLPAFHPGKPPRAWSPCWLEGASPCSEGPPHLTEPVPGHGALSASNPEAGRAFLLSTWLPSSPTNIHFG